MTFHNVLHNTAQSDDCSESSSSKLPFSVRCNIAQYWVGTFIGRWYRWTHVSCCKPHDLPDLLLKKARDETSVVW